MPALDQKLREMGQHQLGGLRRVQGTQRGQMVPDKVGQAVTLVGQAQAGQQVAQDGEDVQLTWMEWEVKIIFL
jgi:hypothetical protein